MKTLNAFEFAPVVGKSTYDWDTLLSGKILQLEEGTDYKCKASTFATLARAAAKKRGLTVRISKTEGGLVIQAQGAGAMQQETPEQPESLPKRARGKK